MQLKAAVSVIRGQLVQVARLNALRDAMSVREAMQTSVYIAQKDTCLMNMSSDGACYAKLNELLTQLLLARTED